MFGFMVHPSRGDGPSLFFEEFAGLGSMMVNAIDDNGTGSVGPTKPLVGSGETKMLFLDQPPDQN
jgi:hypothetical protein